MSSWATPGVKCVCVNAGGGAGCWWGDAPTEGAVYTILGVWTDEDDGRLVLDFVELRRSPSAVTWHGHRIGYDIDRFRPLASRTEEQDLAIFRPILTSIQVGEDA